MIKSVKRILIQQIFDCMNYLLRERLKQMLLLRLRDTRSSKSTNQLAARHSVAKNMHNAVSSTDVMNATNIVAIYPTWRVGGRRPGERAHCDANSFHPIQALLQENRLFQCAREHFGRHNCLVQPPSIASPPGKASCRCADVPNRASLHRPQNAWLHSLRHRGKNVSQH